MTEWKERAGKAAKVTASCVEKALRISSQLLTKLADVMHRHARA